MLALKFSRSFSEMTQKVQQKLLNKFGPQTEMEVKEIYRPDHGLEVSVRIISEQFKDLTRVQQHKLVNEVLQEYVLDESIHALKIEPVVKK